MTKIIKKSKHDKFYTKSEVSRYCLDILYKYTNEDFLYIEPAAGNGSIFNLIKYDKLGLDIEPECDVMKQDYLQWEYRPKNKENVVIITNPPFGNRNNLTNSFINKSMELGNTIAFILPKVYRKETLQNIFPNEWSLVEDVDLPKDSFLLDGIDYHVPAIFQIWIKEHPINLRESNKDKLFTTDFSFGNKNNCEWFIFGASPKNIIRSEFVNKNNRGYYFNANEDVIEILKRIEWNKHSLSCVNGGVCWYTKQMIIDIYIGEFGNVA